MVTIEQQLEEALAKIAALETTVEAQTKAILRHDESFRVIMDAFTRHQHSYSDSSFMGIPTSSFTGPSNLTLYDKNAANAAKVTEDAPDTKGNTEG